MFSITSFGSWDEDVTAVLQVEQGLACPFGKRELPALIKILVLPFIRWLLWPEFETFMLMWSAHLTQWYLHLVFLGEFGLESEREFEEPLRDQNTERLFSGSTENKEY